MTELLWESVTACALSIHHDDPDVLACVRTKILASMPGVGIGLSTAILALTMPDQYGVIDYRVWKVIFGADKRNFLVYLNELRPFAKETGWSMQKADFLIWAYFDELKGVK